MLLGHECVHLRTIWGAENMLKTGPIIEGPREIPRNPRRWTIPIALLRRQWSDASRLIRNSDITPSTSNILLGG